MCLLIERAEGTYKKNSPLWKADTEWIAGAILAAERNVTISEVNACVDDLSSVFSSGIENNMPTLEVLSYFLLILRFIVQRKWLRVILRRTTDPDHHPILKADIRL